MKSDFYSTGQPQLMSLEPVFSNCQEIRMGSPYSLCDLELIGGPAVELPGRDWQDKWARSSDARLLALVSWNHSGNDPGFRILIVDASNGRTEESDRIPGCCHAIEWVDDHFEWTSFPEGQGIVHPNRSG